MKSDKVQFTRIPAGEALLGLRRGDPEVLSLIEEDGVWWESMSPQRLESMPEFSISTSPISYEQVRAVLPGVPIPEGVAVHQVARVGWGVADKAAKLLGGRLPTEDEWEYACRGGSQSLFSFGRLSEDDDPLEPWMRWEVDVGAENGYGLKCLYTGEWCSGFWGLRTSTGPQIEEGVRVMRGGGAYFWPWQDEEWRWCMSASRTPSSQLPDSEWSFRVVLD